MPIENPTRLLATVDGTEFLWRWGDTEATETLLAATVFDPGPPRPDDMAELARLVAKELRRRGIWAEATIDHSGMYAPMVQLPVFDGCRAVVADYHTARDRFNSLTPREIAEVIQAEEAKKAAEWAGDP